MTQIVDNRPNLDRTNIIIGFITLIIALAMYLKTLAPSISFWDCGEFVAASVIFGIPHPPGSPVFIIIGKIFASIPFSGDMAYRVNLISALSSAASVFVAYFITTRIIGYWQTESDNVLQRVGKYTGGVVAALCMGFNRTFWTNAVEAEVYGLTMLVFMVIIYLLVTWYSKHEHRSADRILILVIYLAVLGSGIHMSAFLVLPAALIFVMLVDRRLRTDPRFWILSAAVMSILMNLMFFLVGVASWMVISLVASFMTRKNRQWRLSAALAFAALLGFSIQIYVPIRSGFDPAIDMNNPDNFARLTSFIEREQYGQENMITRMFTRRGDLAHQFGDFPRMGFWRFFSEQYSKPGGMFFLFLLIGFYGLYRALKRNWCTGSLVLLLVLAGTIGLTLYMNFADGTQINATTMAKRLEVRDRDYFWTPGFAMFGICIGLGIAALHRLAVRKLTQSKAGGGSWKAVSLAMALLMLFLPVVSVAHNYRACDRSYDTLPYDYAYNALNTCEEGSILFTAGDNDTFPLWALQYGLGIRPDVRIVNLSLLDTDWYAMQMKENTNVPISLTEDQIMQFPTEIRGQGQVVTIPLPKEKYYDPLRKQNRLLRSFQDENGKIIRVAHQLIENILQNNQWEYPVYFANMPPAEVAYNLREHCERVGMLYRVTKESKNGAVNVEESYRLTKDVYRIRNLGNPKYYRDETATQMALGMAQLQYDLYDELAKMNDSVRAIEIFNDLLKKAPEYSQLAFVHAAVDSTFGIEGKTDQEYKEEYLAFVEELLDYAPDNYYYLQYKGMVFQALGRMEEGIKVLEEAYELMPTSSATYRSLMQAYISARMQSKALEVSRRYLILNPLDQSARRLVNAYGGQ